MGSPYWIRRAFIEVVACSLYYTGILYLIGLVRKWLGRRRYVILMYHHLSCTPAGARVHEFERGPGPEGFDSHLRVMKWFGDIVDLQRGAEALAGKNAQGSRTQITLTFDDGYRDNLTVGTPAMVRHRAAGTVFIALRPQQEQRYLWWDEVIHLVRHAKGNGVLDTATFAGIEGVTEGVKDVAGDDGKVPRHALAERLTDCLATMPMAERDKVMHELRHRLGDGRGADRSNGLYLSWPEIKQMANMGISIGGHTVHHPCLPAEPAYVAQQEITSSRRILQDHLQRPVTAFCYPGGRVSRRVRDQVELAGYRVAVTTQEGVNHPGDDRLMLKRVPISWDKPRHMALKLALYDIFHR